MSKKGSGFTSGTPAIETPLGKQVANERAIAEGFDGKPVHPLSRGELNQSFRVPLQEDGYFITDNAPIATDASTFKDEIRRGLYTGKPIIMDDEQFALRFRQIFSSFRSDIINRGSQLIGQGEPGLHLQRELMKIQYDPSQDISVIKFYVLYLEALFPIICKTLDHHTKAQQHVDDIKEGYS